MSLQVTLWVTHSRVHCWVTFHTLTWTVHLSVPYLSHAHTKNIPPLFHFFQSFLFVSDILLPMDTVSGSEAIWNLGVQAKLCCTSDACSPCILISIQLNSSLVEDEESDYKENLGVWDQDDNGSESGKPKNSKLQTNCNTRCSCSRLRVLQRTWWCATVQ